VINTKNEKLHNKTIQNHEYGFAPWILFPNCSFHEENSATAFSKK
jgi:hypothetical protein